MLPSSDPAATQQHGQSRIEMNFFRLVRNGKLAPSFGLSRLGLEMIRSFVLVVACAAAAWAKKDDSTLASAQFRWSTEGWNGTTKSGDSWPVEGDLGQLKASDDDDTVWYFSASPDFLGNKAEAYGGTISFTLGHSEYNSLGLGAQEEFDIILSSAAHNITLGHKHIIPPWVTSSENVVEISEEGGWVDTETGESATRLSILLAISALTEFKIRGSLYYGHEYAFLKDVSLMRGAKQDLAWVRNDAHIDELCRAMKLNAVACEHYGVHLMKAMQKVNMNKLRADHEKLIKKRKEFESAADERRREWERESLSASKNV